MSFTKVAEHNFVGTAGALLSSLTPDLGAAWAQDSGDMRIDVNEDGLRTITPGYARNTTALGNDQMAEARFRGEQVWILVRYDPTGGGQGYVLEVRDGISTRLWKFSGGGDPRQTQLGSNGTVNASSQLVSLAAVGTTLTAYDAGVPITGLDGISDATYASGSSGLYYTGTTATSDVNYFAAYEESGAGGRTTKNTRSAPLGVNVGMGWRMKDRIIVPPQYAPRQEPLRLAA